MSKNIFLRIVELIFEWWALLYRQGVGLPGELLSNHLQVTVDQGLVPDVRGIT